MVWRPDQTACHREFVRRAVMPDDEAYMNLQIRSGICGATSVHDLGVFAASELKSVDCWLRAVANRDALHAPQLCAPCIAGIGRSDLPAIVSIDLTSLPSPSQQS